MLEINKLNVSYKNKSLLHNINLIIPTNYKCLLTGANGSGKTTLVNTISGHPEYTITEGKIIFNDIDITNQSPTKRALLGIFTGSQNVPEIPGLTILSFLKHSLNAHHKFNNQNDISMKNFLYELDQACDILNIPTDWLNRSVNVGFSGGERKKLMLLHLLLLKPKFAILDEPDSGSDTVTQSLITQTIKTMTTTSFLVISHQELFSNTINFDCFCSLSEGKIMIKS